MMSPNPDPVPLALASAGAVPAAAHGAAAAPRAAKPLFLELAMANRHGLVAGATGTGKTVTVHALAERLSSAGVPVFLVDVKGDLAGMAAPGRPAGEPGSNAKVEAALAAAGLAGRPRTGLPCAPWDVFGERGVPLRATVSDMGPLILGRALGLGGVQAEVLSLLFQAADDRGLDMIDLKDLRAVLDWCAASQAELEARYGRMATATLSAIRRAVVVLEGQGGDRFFGEPALDIGDFLKRDEAGRGQVNLLAADRLIESPGLYAAFLLWLLSELFEELPETGDLPAPRLVFCFDEAHLLFEGASEELLRSVARTVRLIRSKGVGLWFVTQNPLDLPEPVLAQLGNRILHALRAYSPRERQALRAAARSFRENPELDAERALGELAVGEALVSLLGADGVPAPVTRARIVPPLSRVGPLSPEERASLIGASAAMARYGKPLDRVSAFEALRDSPGAGAGTGPASATGAASAAGAGSRAAPQPPRTEAELQDAMAALEAELHGLPGEPSPAEGSPRPRRAPAARSPASPEPGEELLESFARQALRSAGTELGRQLVRGVLGGLSSGSRRRRSPR